MLNETAAFTPGLADVAQAGQTIHETRITGREKNFSFSK